MACSRAAHSRAVQLSAEQRRNLVNIQEAYKGDTTAYQIVMQLCEGGELGDKLRELKRFDEGDAAVIIADLLAALESLHSINIVHRDVKPRTW